MLKIVAIIQARMGSTRYPGKVLAEIGGRPMLWYTVTRLRQARTLKHIAVATTDQPSDDPIGEFCDLHGIPLFRGSEDDVLERYYGAAKAFKADAVVRITGDCPLLDPSVVDDVVRRFLDGDVDYVSNICPPTYPDGLDTEVFSLEALQRAHAEAEWASEREHVTSYIRKHPETFRIQNVTHAKDLSSLRWTVDDDRDMAFVRAVFERLEDVTSGLDVILSLLERHPEIAAINAGTARNEGYLRSIKEDHCLGQTGK